MGAEVLAMNPTIQSMETRANALSVNPLQRIVGLNTYAARCINGCHSSRLSARRCKLQARAVARVKGEFMINAWLKYGKSLGPLSER
jgi:hypothetical protein